jgi:cellulose synthase/poly-beta-1,6-N-acetylglucosamine synthase-like glycosyltransferase
MERTALDAEIIGIIDADYVVTPTGSRIWFPLVDPRVGLVQAQEHRDGDRSRCTTP